jgi:hypothetical protein
VSLPAIRKRYGCPAKRGKAVKFEGRPAVITGTPRSHGHHLNLRFDGEAKTTGPFHPLWEIDYLDGIDHGALYDARIEAFNRALAASRAHTEEKGEGR